MLRGFVFVRTRSMIPFAIINLRKSRESLSLHEISFSFDSFLRRSCILVFGTIYRSNKLLILSLDNSLLVWELKFEYLKKMCSKYDVNHVYKKCNDEYDDSWIIVLEKMHDTNTNENRIDIRNIATAKYRANKLKVVDIINMNTPSITKKEIISTYHPKCDNKKTKYKVGDIVYPDYYDPFIENVCSNGIHYFRKIEAAYFYGDMPDNYFGNVTVFHDNGGTYSEGLILRGRKHG